MKKREEKPQNHERWLLTYSDLITLLMIFFVILYASSSINQKKYDSVSNSFKEVFGGGKNVVGEQQNPPSKSEGDKINLTKEKTEEEKLSQLKKEIDKSIKNAGLANSVNATLEKRGLVVSFNNRLFFDSGKAELRPECRDELIKISSILKKVPNYIRIEGYTDNLPIKTEQFKSNWQLSSARAANVSQFLVDKGAIEPEKVSAVGYSEYRPLESNSTEDGRIKNRRVDIVILNNKFNATENN